MGESKKGHVSDKFREMEAITRSPQNLLVECWEQKIEIIKDKMH